MALCFLVAPLALLSRMCGLQERLQECIVNDDWAEALRYLHAHPPNAAANNALGRTGERLVVSHQHARSFPLSPSESL